MGYKRLTQKFALILLMMIFFIVVPLISYDPLHLYHKSWFAKDSRLHSNMRLQAAGIINNYKFDSMIVGTSMLNGSSSAYASSKLGNFFVNLSAGASNLYERNLIIKHALKKKNIKQIIYSFDTGLDANLKKNNNSLPLNKFNYLYDANPFNDVYAYWNSKFIGCTLTLSKSSKCIGGNRGLIRSKKWFESIVERNRNISSIKNWITAHGRGRNIYARILKHKNKPFNKKYYNKMLVKSYKIIDAQLLKTIEQNKNVSFHIVMPPYSRLQYALWKQYNPLKYLLYKNTMQYLAEKSFVNDNMFLYILDDLPYLDNLENYRDMRHYNIDMNRLIIDYIAEKKYIDSKSSLMALFQTIDIKNKNYKVKEHIDKIIEAYKFKYSATITYSKDKGTIKGWALAYKVTNVALFVNNKFIKNVRLKRNKVISEKYPRYMQRNSLFLFKNIKIKSKQDVYKLVFKNKNKIIKTVILNKTKATFDEK